MKLIHLILAHDTTSIIQLARLVNKLNHTDSLVYMHIDIKSDLNIFVNHFNAYSNVRFINKRVNIKWAGYSMIEAEQYCFEQILLEEPNFDYLNLLSAQDYPIRPIEEFHQFLIDNIGKAFMHCLDVETEWEEAKERVTRYHLINYNFKGKYFLENILNKLSPKRIVPYNMVIKGRSQWFTISKKHVIYIVNELNINKKFVRFFKLTWAPDEIIFQTLLFNSPYREDIINNNLRFIDWSEGNKNPKTFTSNNFDQIIDSNQFFGRKFNSSIDSKILDLIDQHISK